MATNYLLARNVTDAVAMARGLNWARLPTGAERLPSFRTPRGKIVQYITAEGLRGTELRESIIFFMYDWQRNALARQDVIDWAVSRGAKLVNLYEGGDCEQCDGSGCDVCGDTGKVEY